MARIATSAERLLAPLDWVRAATLRQLGPYMRGLLRDRSARVRVLGAGAVASALSLALAAPLVTLSVTPLLFGVPHLLGDIRYLVVRQGLHRRRVFLGAVALCLTLGTGGAPLVWGACAVALGALFARAPAAPRAGVLSVCLALGALASYHGHVAGVWFAHVHNLVALVVWFVWARSRRALLPALVGAGAASVALWAGAFDGVLMRAATGQRAWSVEPGVLEDTLTLTHDPVWALRALAFFAFNQSLHYAVWLKLVPEEDRARRGVRSFVASYRALVNDVGVLLPVAALMSTLTLCLYALRDLDVARSSYLHFAAFHGPLELALLVLLALERRAPLREDATIVSLKIARVHATTPSHPHAESARKC